MRLQIVVLKKYMHACVEELKYNFPIAQYFLQIVKFNQCLQHLINDKCS